MSDSTRVQFDDVILPVISNSGGVYNLRQRTQTGTGSVRAPSLSKAVSEKERDLEGYDTNDVQDGDVHKKQVRHSHEFFTHIKLTSCRLSLDGICYGLRINRRA